MPRETMAPGCENQGSPQELVHLILDFEGLPVHYREIRKFGHLSLVEDGFEPAAMAHIGPVTPRRWLERIARRRGPVKACLLDQGIASGLGTVFCPRCQQAPGQSTARPSRW